MTNGDIGGELRSRLIAQAEAFVDAPNFLALAAMHETAYLIYNRAQGRTVDAAAQSAKDARDDPPWRSVDDPYALGAGFRDFKVTFDRPLSDDETQRVGRALQYALDWMIGGEMSAVRVVRTDEAGTVMEYGYDSTKSELDAPDPDAAFLLAHRYIEEGTPVRRKEGTPLMEGIGGEQIARFYVR